MRSAFLPGSAPKGQASQIGHGRQFYVRFKLFNPDRLFARMVPLLRWVWTPGFVVTTLLLMLLALLLSSQGLGRSDELRRVSCCANTLSPYSLPEPSWSSHTSSRTG